MGEQDDRGLLVAWSSGDTAAGDAFMRRFFPPLWRYFRNKIDRDVDDVIQATLAACVRHRDTIAASTSVRAYVFTMARHQLYAHLRARPDFDPLTHSVAAARTSPSSAAARNDARMRLREALRGLPCALQETVELHLDEELRGPELAAALGVPEGTVRSRLRRAKSILTERLGVAVPKLTEAAVG
ncbi:MAG: sigma-70 family RNA polymerase sigma factor [Myxococcota bacterium]